MKGCRCLLQASTPSHVANTPVPPAGSKMSSSNTESGTETSSMSPPATSNSEQPNASAVMTPSTMTSATSIVMSAMSLASPSATTPLSVTSSSTTTTTKSTSTTTTTKSYSTICTSVSASYNTYGGTGPCGGQWSLYGNYTGTYEIGDSGASTTSFASQDPQDAVNSCIAWVFDQDGNDNDAPEIDVYYDYLNSTWSCVYWLDAPVGVFNYSQDIGCSYVLQNTGSFSCG
ncbi:hypothetical protein ANO11243_050010 [Dothideomycetidae sp. 11243]|nr:hypothetical protein ANO11243_050010 [fungal sp. No.11243]